MYQNMFLATFNELARKAHGMRDSKPVMDHLLMIYGIDKIGIADADRWSTRLAAAERRFRDKLGNAPTIVNVLKATNTICTQLSRTKPPAKVTIETIQSIRSLFFSSYSDLFQGQTKLCSPVEATVLIHLLLMNISDSPEIVKRQAGISFSSTNQSSSDFTFDKRAKAMFKTLSRRQKILWVERLLHDLEI
jgi:hypothetical protein